MAGHPHLDPALLQVRQVEQLFAAARKYQGQAGRRRDAIELFAAVQARQEQCIHARRLIGRESRDGVVDAGKGGCAGAAIDPHRARAARSHCGAHLADAFLKRCQLRLVACAKRTRQQRVLDADAGHPGRLQFLDGTHHRERIAVAMVGIDDQPYPAGTAYPARLLRQFGERQQDQVRCAENRQCCDGSAHDAEFEAKLVGDAGRHRVEQRAGNHALVACQDPAQARGAIA